MSHSNRRRTSSPPGHRIPNSMRASTGAMSLNPSPYPRAHGPRLNTATTTIEPRLEAHPISSQTIRDPGHSTKHKTRYAIRSRPRSNTATTPSTGRRDSVPSSSKRPSSSGYAASPPSYSSQLQHILDVPERPLMTTSSRDRRRHRLDNDADYTSDSGGLYPGYRLAGTREKHYGGYPERDSRRRLRYPNTGAPKIGGDVDPYDTYSYTTPREQFDTESKDKSARLHHIYGKERPLSMTGVEDYYRPLPKTESRPPGPPAAYRGYDKVDSQGLSRLPELGTSPPYYQYTRQRPPVSVHQDRDDLHSSLRHQNHRRRYRRHDDIIGNANDRKYYDGISLRPQSGVNTSVPRLGSAGLGGVYNDDNYGLSTRYGRAPPQDLEHDYRSYRSPLQRPFELDDGSDNDIYFSDRERRSRGRKGLSGRGRESDSNGSSEDDEGPSQRIRMSRSRKNLRSNRGVEHSLPGENRRTNDNNEPRKKHIAFDLEPEKEPETAPKGILKTPTDKFPEDPNPVREGVAPLKDTPKKGIPPGARWTKINRNIVNPAALEAGHERFEERSEHVIVLRVLSEEEIQAYAVITQEIRESRQREYNRERRKSRYTARRYGLKGGSLDDTSEDDDGPLAIEAPPESEKLPSRHPQVLGA